MPDAVSPPPADTAQECCGCTCEHQCVKDPAVIGHQGCVACKWCSCRAHPVFSPPADDPRYPGGDLEFYGVRGSLYAEGGCVVFGHGRRALAAANAMARYEGGSHWRTPWRASDGKQPVRQLWAGFHETCGCDADDHAAGHPNNDFDPSCDCDFAGLPPCDEEFEWLVQTSEAEKPGCLPIVEVKW